MSKRKVLVFLFLSWLCFLFCLAFKCKKFEVTGSGRKLALGVLQLAELGDPMDGIGVGRR